MVQVHQGPLEASIQEYLDACCMPWIVTQARYATEEDGVIYLQTIIVVRQYNACAYPWGIATSTKMDNEDFLSDSYLRLLVEGITSHMANRVYHE